ncbi:MAG: hypothetical protein HIU84_13765 [Acidobacteria bacterium]|nr:hypothetical protein [Acidobacteriota bacterium]
MMRATGTTASSSFPGAEAHDLAGSLFVVRTEADDYSHVSSVSKPTVAVAVARVSGFNATKRKHVRAPFRGASKRGRREYYAFATNRHLTRRRTFVTLLPSRTSSVVATVIDKSSRVINTIA